MGYGSIDTFLDAAAWATASSRTSEDGTRGVRGQPLAVDDVGHTAKGWSVKHLNTSGLLSMPVTITS